MSKSDVDAILARQREINEEFERLQKEMDELAIALKVLRRFSPSPDATESKLGPPRPADAPTLFEMAETVIRDAERNGRGGLTRSELITAIGDRFWPGVKGPQILPPIYQFAKKGRLRKTKGGKFRTVKKNEASDGDASDASDDEGGTSSSIESRFAAEHPVALQAEPRP